VSAQFHATTSAAAAPVYFWIGLQLILLGPIARSLRG